MRIPKSAAVVAGSSLSCMARRASFAAPIRLSRTAVAIVLVALALPCSAQFIDGFNHDEYHWQVIETEHFRVIYHQGLDHAATMAAQYAERWYGPLTDVLGEPDEMTDIILSTHTSVGIYGGFTYPLNHRIYLAGLSMFGARGPRDDLLESILAHELVHSFAHWPCQRGDLGTGFEHTNWRTLSTWFVEGIAEHLTRDEPDALGGDLVRCAILDGELTDLAAMAVRDWDDIDDISLTYRVGQGLVAHLVRTYAGGDNSIIYDIHKKHSHFPVFDRALRHTIGVSEEELFDSWLAEAKAYYSEDAATRHDTREYTTEFPTPYDQIFGARWSPDGKRVAILGYKDSEEWQAQLFIADVEATDYYSIALELDEVRSTQFSWSPDGRYLVYSGYHSESEGRVITGIYVHDIETGERQLITEKRLAMDPAWSPDGKWIAYVSISDNGDEHQLAIMRPDGSERKNLTGNPELAGLPATAGYSPVWSPDSQRIACEIVGEDHRPNIAVVSVDGSPVEWITQDTDANVSPAWWGADKEDPGRIAFLSGRSGRFDVWSYDLATGEFSQHTDEGIAMIGNPTWTLDGGGITYALSRVRSGSIRTVPYSYVLATVSAEEKQQPLDLGLREQPRLGNSVEGQASLKTDESAAGEETEQQTEVEPAEQVAEETAEPSDEDGDASAEDVILKRYAYSSSDRFKTGLLRPTLRASNTGFRLGITWRGSDPLNKHNTIIDTAYDSWTGRPVVEATYVNAQNRSSWQTSGFYRNPEGARVGGQRMLAQGIGGDVRARFLRATGSSTYRRDVVELGIHTENARLFGQQASVYARQGQLTFAEAQWTRSKDMPTRGGWMFINTIRQSIPGLSAYPLSEARSLTQWTYESSAGRQSLVAQIEGRYGRASSWGGQAIQGGYVQPTMVYTFRIADDALPGLWPYFYMDRIEGRIAYQYMHNFGTPLYQADGHGLQIEIENRGYITKLVPYTLRIGANIDSRAPSLMPQPYAFFEFNLAQF